MNSGTLPATALRVRKRTGDLVDFNRQKIRQAVMLCLVNGCRRENDTATNELADKITHSVERHLARGGHDDVTVEQIQDLVELVLMANGEHDAARQYIIYREEHRRLREQVLNEIDPETLHHLVEDNKRFRTDLAAFQHYDKYARFNDANRRRETFPEAVNRVIAFFYDHLEKHHQNVLSPSQWSELRDAMVDEQVSPAMRVMQMAGPALDRCNSGAFNCLSRDTRFVTSQGVISFEDCEDGDTVMVLTHTGKWQRAVVRNYGEQMLYRHTFHKGSTKRQVWATRDHRWLLDTPGVKSAVAVGGYPSLSDTEQELNRMGPWETTELEPGNRLVRAPMPFIGFDYDNASPFEKLYWAYGFVFGDGSVVNKNGKPTNSQVRLCGDKIAYLPRFRELGFNDSQPLSLCESGDVFVYTGRYLKTLPDLAVDGPELVRAFVRGWLDADGAKSHGPSNLNPFQSLQVTGQAAIDFVRSVFPCVGVYLTREEPISMKTNYGLRSDVTVRFGLLAAAGAKPNSCYVLAEVDEDSPRQESVWCLEVEEDHSFVLDSGIVTGNCSYTAFDCVEAFAEALYLSMQGCGVGFSVENHYVGQLPLIAKRQSRPLTPELAAVRKIALYPAELTWNEEHQAFDIHDTTEAWCDSVKLLLFSLYAGFDVRLRYHLIRDAGTPLKTKPGTASGPQPLIDLHRFIRKVFGQRQGSRLRDIDAHDIGCFIGQVGQLGGVRRAAMISLSDLSSDEMRKAKFGAYYNDPNKTQRTMANNSAVYDERPDYEVFMQEWTSLAISKSGERGIFNRGSLFKQMPAARAANSANILFGTNPCGEVILRSCGFCNLSIAVVRVDDTAETLRAKVRLAAILGTIQSTLTDYSYIRPVWKKNAEEERLLGVDLLGAMDCPLLRDRKHRDALLAELKQIVIDTNREFATKMGIPVSAANTVIKPGGNSSVRYTTGQTMSGWLSKYMVRNVEVAKRNAMFQFLRDEGVPWETSYRDKDTAVFSFPYPAPENGFIVSDLVTDADGNVTSVKPRRTAIDQLEDWLAFKRHWTEHNPSVSIYVADDEWLAVGDWVQKHWEEIGGLAFFPLDCGIYRQAPMQPMTKKQFDEFVTRFPSRIAWERLPAYDGGKDNTDVRAEPACAGGACNI